MNNSTQRIFKGLYASNNCSWNFKKLKPQKYKFYFIVFYLLAKITYYLLVLRIQQQYLNIMFEGLHATMSKMESILLKTFTCQKWQMQKFCWDIISSANIVRYSKKCIMLIFISHTNYATKNKNKLNSEYFTPNFQYFSTFIFLNFTSTIHSTNSTIKFSKKKIFWKTYKNIYFYNFTNL